MKTFTCINQLDYKTLEYPTTMNLGDTLKKPYPTVAMAGCGLCCVCMLVEALRVEKLTIEECIALSIQSGANRNGTDMIALGIELSKRYHLKFKTSSKLEELKLCLHTGGCAIINAGKPNGIFSDKGHFLFLFHCKDNITWIVDPSYRKDKYLQCQRQGVVKIKDDYILAGFEVVVQECNFRSPSFYLFWQ